MRKLSKKISMLMVLAMLVSLFSGVVSASAASAWSFKSAKYDVAVGETIEMEKNEYADFDLYKNDAAPEGYTVKWSSSDSDVVWVNAKTGQLRADKMKKADLGDKAVISATFTNTATGKSATRSFTIVVAEKAEYEITVNFGDEVLAVGQKYDLAAVVKADGEEVEAKVAFAIDGKAIDAAYTPDAEGEFTIVTTATVDGKVVATAKTAIVVTNAGLESAKQTAYNAVALTFGSADVAKAVAADASKLSAVWLAGENEINAFVKTVKVDEKNAKVVNVELYNTISKDTTYKFTYADKSASIVGVDLTKYAAISIATTAVPKGEDAEVKVNFYNAEGILVDVKTEGFSLTADNSGDYYVGGNTIYFYDQGKSAVVTATYFMGYDENGNMIEDLKATGTITSYDKYATTSGMINGWAVVDEIPAGKTVESLTFGGNSVNLAVADASKELYFKFTVTDLENDKTDYYNVANKKGEMYDAFAGFEYSTTNDGVVLVDENTGILYPVAAGTAQIVVKSIASYDPNVKNVIGVLTVNVVEHKQLTSIAPITNKAKLATATETQLDEGKTFDTVWIKPQAKDQFNADFVPTYKLELAKDVDGVAIEIKTANAVVEDGVETSPAVWEPLVNDPTGEGNVYTTTGSDNGVPYFEIRAISAANWTKTVQVAVTANQGYPYKNITKGVNIQVKNAGNISKYSLDGLTTNFDLNVAGKPDWAAGIWYYSTDIKLNAYDSDGYFVNAIDMGKTKDNAVDDYYYTVKKGNDDLTLDTSVVDGNKFHAFDRADDGEGGSLLVKRSNHNTGTYVVTAYKIAGNNEGRQLDRKSIVVTDSSTPITVIQKDNKIAKSAVTGVTGSSLEAVIIDELTEDFKFMRGGQELKELDIVDIAYTMTNDSKKIYITSVTVREKFWGFNVTYAEQYTAYDIKINGVGKVFEVDQYK